MGNMHVPICIKMATFSQKLLSCSYTRVQIYGGYWTQCNIHAHVHSHTRPH